MEQIGLLPKSSNKIGPAAQTPQRTSGAVTELPQVARADVWEFVMLPVAPEIFHRIQFRRVSRQVFDGNYPIQAADCGEREACPK